MTRVAPAAALLGGYVLHEHARAVPALRTAAARVAQVLRAAGLTVLTGPSVHVPGTVAVRAAPAAVRAAPLAADVGCGTVDETDAVARPGCPAGAELSVVTCAAG